MNIFDQVMEMETEGETLYRDFAKQTTEPGVGKIFSLLADQEQKHYETFKKMKEGKSVIVAEDTILQGIKDVFEEWKKEMFQADFKISQADLYRQALETEQKSALLYKEHARKAATKERREMGLSIACEERNHELVLENIIDFIAKPEYWVENAKFSNLGENYYL
jgi:rubrerythrin